MTTRLADDQLHEEVMYYVLQCVMRHEATSTELRKQFVAYSMPSTTLLQDAVAAAARLAIVAAFLPTSKVQLKRMKPRNMRTAMVKALDESGRRVLSAACGAHNSGAMNATNAMTRACAAVELAQHAEFVREWTGKL